MFIDTSHPIFFYIEDCVNLSKLRRELHTSYQNALKILESERIPVYRQWHGKRHSCYVYRIHARELILKHGSEYARKQRMIRSAGRPKGSPLQIRCHLCNKQGRQWRCGCNAAGRLRIKCGHCKRHYTVGQDPPIQVACVHCGNDTLQYRHHVSPAGNLTIRCGQCKRYYTVGGNPAPSIPAWMRPRPPVDLVEW